MAILASRELQPNRGSPEKTHHALVASEIEPEKPLMLSEIEGANFLEVLLHRKVQLGVHAITMSVGERGNAHLTVFDTADRPHGLRWNQDHLPNDMLRSALKNTFEAPRTGSIGFTVLKRGDEHFLVASGFFGTAEIRMSEIDSGLGDTLRTKEKSMKQPREKGIATTGLIVDYQFRLPFTAKETLYTLVIPFEAE